MAEKQPPPPPSYDQSAVQPGYPSQPPPQPVAHPGYAPQPTVIMQPAVMGAMSPFTQFPQNITCPSCRANVVTKVDYMIGSFTWLLVAILFFFACFLCCWIPCVVESCKDAVHRCPNCQVVVGTFRRI